MGGLSSCCSAEPAENRETIKGAAATAAHDELDSAAQEHAEATMRYPRNLGRNDEPRTEHVPGSASAGGVSEVRHARICALTDFT